MTIGFHQLPRIKIVCIFYLWIFHFHFFFFFMGLEQVDKIEDSFDIINSGTKPLAAYLFTNNKKLKQQFVETVSAGGLVINDTAVHVIMLALLKNHTLLRSYICTY